MATPSPSCEIKNGSAAYVTAVGGVDVDPGNTVIIKLSSQADVDSWLIECATTDDSSDAATVTASLVIDSTLKTATFTAPSAGKAYRFRSKVNGGIDRNGIAKTSYATTFCVYTRKNGRRVIATDETTETDSTFGWTKWQNDLIRSTPTGAGPWAAAASPGGAAGQVQWNEAGTAISGGTGIVYVPTAGVAEFNRGLRVIGTAVATLANAMLGAGTAATGFHLVQPVMHAPIIGGTAVFTGTDMKAMGLADHQPVSVIRKVLTTDATVTPVFAFKPTDEAITSVVAEVNAVPSGGGAGGSYVRRVSIMMDGGVGTCGALESSWSDEFRSSALGFTGIAVGSGIWIGMSGATGFVNVKGSPTGQFKWGVTVTLQTTSWS